jgi:hypothetical protein
VSAAGLVTVIIGLAASLILIVIGSFFKEKIQLWPIGSTAARAFCGEPVDLVLQSPDRDLQILGLFFLGSDRLD